MNDNLIAEGPNHAAALALLNDLMLVLSNASRQGLERYDANGEPVYNFAFWANECGKVIGPALLRKFLADKSYGGFAP